MNGDISKYKYKYKYRHKEVAYKIVERLKEMKLNIRLMHACGTHQDTIVKHGLDHLLKGAGVEVRQGPGCPVCITPQREIEEGIILAKNGITIATYGDMVRVPGLKKSLLDMRGEGCDVRIVYSIEDAVAIARENKKKEVVFFAIGFETTAPSTAWTILNTKLENFSILNCHRYFLPALKALIAMGEVKLHGLIEPGHVSTIIGLKPYEEISQKYFIPQVIAGFEPLDVLIAIYMLAKQIKSGEAKVENEYTRAVRYKGNEKALSIMNTVFEPCDIDWRGFDVIPDSGMKLKREFEQFDARKKFQAELEELKQFKFIKPKGCKCDEVLRGLIYSYECPLFARACSPQHPIGPCMVSIEGSCNIEYKYGKR
jgi:hydrogenase expression/formation protein HypD